ncbi:MAG: acetyl-CoA carboxylase carboxyltransferase subunit alpha [Deltaproteobacteria bacterium]|nr:acetyl-CoA carboxylase carboxyltransferase subunit alpha [Deltaproteobacteria bacterium]
MAGARTMPLEFEKPLVELEQKIEELRQLSESGTMDFESEIRKLEKKAAKLQKEIYADLDRWQIVQLSRHSARPFTLDYVGHLCTDFVEIHGDRRFADDPSMITGFAFFRNEPVCVIGHQKGRTTKENMVRNFGMSRPEGYRKAARVMQLAERFGRPILTFVDTPGAYPGIGAEERGQAEAVAENLELMAGLKVPIVSVVIGEGGSGGALAIAVADRLLMLEYSTFSVITPEACSSILYRDPGQAKKAAESLKLTARDLDGFGICDEVLPEPSGGAHRDPLAIAKTVGDALKKHLTSLQELPLEQLLETRFEKYRSMGEFIS